MEGVRMIPSYEAMMLPLLRALAGGAQSVRACLVPLQQELGISGAEAQVLLPNGKQTVLSNRVHWARTYLSKAGLLSSPRRGQHLVTPAGHALLAQGLVQIDTQFLREYSPEMAAWLLQSRAGEMEKSDPNAPSFPAAAIASDTRGQGAPSTPSEAIEVAAKALNGALQDEVLELIRGMHPFAFERLVLRLLEAMGYGGNGLGQRITTQPSGDGGIDGILHEDALGLDAVYFQAKCYAVGRSVGRPALQQFVGSLTGEGATKGVFVTTSSYSAEARGYVERVQQRIILIDEAELARLLVRHSVGVRVVQTIEIKAIDENIFADL
jgi:restriction system protein